jgi:hypothetical protein
MIHNSESVQTSRSPARRPSHLRSDRLLAELLALNEEMMAQLKLERREVPKIKDFLTGMIDQHEKAATSLRTQLKRFRSASR